MVSHETLIRQAASASDIQQEIAREIHLSGLERVDLTIPTQRQIADRLIERIFPEFSPVALVVNEVTNG